MSGGEPSDACGEGQPGVGVWPYSSAALTLQEAQRWWPEAMVALDLVVAEWGDILEIKHEQADHNLRYPLEATTVRCGLPYIHGSSPHVLTVWFPARSEAPQRPFAEWNHETETWHLFYRGEERKYHA